MKTLANITLSKLFLGRNIPYFQPSVTRCPDGRLLLTMQTFLGASDTYGPLEYSFSCDDGFSWTQPEMHPELGARITRPGIRECIADGRCRSNEVSNTVLYIGGQTTYNLSERRMLFDAPSRPVFSIMDCKGNWGPRQYLQCPELDRTCGWVPGGSQFLWRKSDNRLLLPVHVFSDPARPSSFCTLATILGKYDGKTIEVEQVSRLLGDGIEPGGFCEGSVIESNGAFQMTLRSEETDKGAYWCASQDGLDWSEPQPWRFDDGRLLGCNNTQTHFLTIADTVFLAYTRRDAENEDVFRYRSPLFLAPCDPMRGIVFRDGERGIMPLEREKDGTPGRRGNFDIHEIGGNIALAADAPLWCWQNSEGYIDRVRTEVQLSRLTFA